VASQKKQPKKDKKELNEHDELLMRKLLNEFSIMPEDSWTKNLYDHSTPTF